MSFLTDEIERRLRLGERFEVSPSVSNLSFDGSALAMKYGYQFVRAGELGWMRPANHCFNPEDA